MASAMGPAVTSTRKAKGAVPVSSMTESRYTRPNEGHRCRDLHPQANRQPGGDRGAVFNLPMPADPCGRLELGKWQLVWPRTSAAGT